MKKGKSSQNLVFIYFVLIFILNLIFYFPLTNFQFVWDDTQLYINPQNIPPENPLGKTIDNFLPRKDKMYIPVTYFFWSLIGVFGGVEENYYKPKYYHLFNLIIHILNSFLVFLLFKKLIGEDFWAFTGSLIYSLHPIQIESIAWISEARGLLSTFWGICAILFYMKSWNRSIKVPFVIFFLLLSILSKPSGIVFPIILVIIDWHWYKTRNFVFLLKSNFWYLLIIIPFVLISLQGESTKTIVFEIPFYFRFVFWLNSIGFYLEKFLLPIYLSPGYGLTYNFMMKQPIYFYSVILGFALIILGFFIKRKEYWFGVLLFVVGFLPVSNLITYYYQYWSTVADRYIYFSIIGFIFIVVYFGREFFVKYRTYYLSALIFVFFVLSRGELVKWENEFSLWNECITKYPKRIPHPYLGRGIIYESQSKLLDALDDYSIAIKIDSSYYFGYYNRGNVYYDLKKYNEAIHDFTKAISLNPKYVNSYVNRGLCYLEVGDYFNAKRDFSFALVLDSTQADVWFFLGEALSLQKKYSDAIESYKKAKKFGYVSDTIDKIIKNLEF